MLRLVKDPKWVGWLGWFEDESGTMLARLENDGTFTPMPDAPTQSFYRKLTAHRTPPEQPDAVDERLYDLKSERKLLGTMLVHPRVSDELRDLLPDRDVFWDPAHGFVFDAIRVACQDVSKAVTIAGVCEVLRDKAHLELVGGCAALLELVKQASPGHGQWHAERVAAKAAIRAALRELAEYVDKSGHATPG